MMVRSAFFGVLALAIAAGCSSPQNEVDSPPTNPTGDSGPTNGPTEPTNPDDGQVGTATAGPGTATGQTTTATAGVGTATAQPSAGRPRLSGTVKFVGKPCPPQMGAAIKTPPCDGPYPGYEIVIFKADGKTQAGKTTTDAQGQYEIALEAGSYVILVPGGLPPNNKPQKREVTVAGSGPTKLDLTVDTGVR